MAEADATHVSDPLDDHLDISVIVPVRDNAGTLRELLDRTVSALSGAGDFELVVVDDASRDSSWEIIRSASEADPRISGLRIHPGRGQAVAVATAMHHIRGRSIAYIDADLEYSPEDLPRILESLADGADVACGVRPTSTGRAWHRRAMTALVTRGGPSEVRSRILDPGCGIKGWRRDFYRRAFPTDHLIGGLLQVQPMAMASSRVDNISVEWQRSIDPSRYRFGPLLLNGLEYQLLGRPELARTALYVGAASAAAALVSLATPERANSRRGSLNGPVSIGLAGAALGLNAVTASLVTTSLRSAIPAQIVSTVGRLDEPGILRAASER